MPATRTHIDFEHYLKLIIKSSPSENFVGQNSEIMSMTRAAGCDIAEHVPTLVLYGRLVETITEMGVRFGWSTRSFLFARPKSLLSIDKFDWDSVHQSGAIRKPGNSQYKKYCELYKNIVDFRFLKADTTELEPIEQTDLLCIDTFHHRDCLRIELEKHGNKAQKFILLHDTETFGVCGQADDSCLFFKNPTTDESGTGLWFAINPWLQQNPHWEIREVYRNNNGLTVLERQ